MREIKFRVRMMDSDGYEGPFVYANLDEMIIWNSKNGRYYGSVNWKTLGEYKGLKDKNGKEIYEGDIISREYLVFGVNYESMNNVVIFLLGEFTTDSKKFTECGVEKLSDCEIIGNIYETPDLIK